MNIIIKSITFVTRAKLFIALPLSQLGIEATFGATRSSFKRAEREHESPHIAAEFSALFKWNS